MELPSYTESFAVQKHSKYGLNCNNCSASVALLRTANIENLKEQYPISRLHSYSSVRSLMKTYCADRRRLIAVYLRFGSTIYAVKMYSIILALKYIMCSTCTLFGFITTVLYKYCLWLAV